MPHLGFNRTTTLFPETKAIEKKPFSMAFINFAPSLLCKRLNWVDKQIFNILVVDGQRIEWCPQIHSTSPSYQNFSGLATLNDATSPQFTEGQNKWGARSYIRAYRSDMTISG